MRTPFLPAGARWPSAGRELIKWSRTARSRRRADRVRRTRVRYARKASNKARLASTEPRRRRDRRLALPPPGRCPVHGPTLYRGPVVEPCATAKVGEPVRAGHLERVPV